MIGATPILHADLDAFFAAVEQRDDPRLRGRPIAVGGGVVMCASYEARARGVRGAMNGGEARRRCPELIFVEPRLDAYSEASRAVFALFEDTTPFVEGISIDEAFLDVGGLRKIAGSPEEIAVRLRRDVRDRIGLPISVGAARTKFLAKVASASAKPDGLIVVPPDSETGFLHPLPVERMWGVGAKTAAKLHARGVSTIGDLAALPAAALEAIVGQSSGHHLHALANHRDPRRVQRTARRRSIGSQRALGRRPKTADTIDATLLSLVDRVTRRLRGADRVCRTITIRLRFDDFTRSTRSSSLEQATDDTATVLAVARRLLDGVHDAIDQRGLTLLGLSLSNLDDDDAVQLTLPFHHRDVVDTVLDDVRQKYGSSSIRRAVLLGTDEGYELPLLPDR